MEMNPVTDGGYYSYIPDTTTKRQSQFNTDLFMKLLSTQLSHQDPFEPMSNSEVFDNISKMANVDTTAKMNEKMTQLVNAFDTMNAAGMIGKQIVGTSNTTGDLVSGKVQSVSSFNGALLLTIKDDISGQLVKVSPGNVQQINA